MDVTLQEMSRVLASGKGAFDTIPDLDIPAIVFEKETVKLLPIVKRPFSTHRISYI